MFHTVRIKLFLVLLLLPNLLGGLGALFSGDIKAQYVSLPLPPFAPPAWFFGVAWVVLYLLIGFASYLVFVSKAPEQEKIQALTFYTIQLLLNAAWTPLFFGGGFYRAAFYLLCAILVLAILTAVYFFYCNKTAGILMLPYVVWLLFAAALCRAILNQQSL